MILTLALLLMCGVGIGTLLLLSALFKFVTAIHRNQATADVSHSSNLLHLSSSLHNHDEASRNRQLEVIGYIERGSAQASQSGAAEHRKTRTRIQSLLDVAGQPTPIDVQSQASIAMHLDKISGDLQQIKTRLADEEKTDQANKRKARLRKH